MVDELERIKLRKMGEMRKQMEQNKKLQEDQKNLEENKRKIIAAVLEADAYQYFEDLKKRDTATATEIENLVISLALNKRLKYKLEAVEIEALERKIKGVEPRIVIKRRGGDEIDLTEKLKRGREEEE
ncbi:MAG: DNA-binding protein [Promethearchaeati archaeon SRVP18_Atabeyarchaeia-1]